MNFVCTPEGRLAPSPVEDAPHLDQRRAEMGLLPMRLYSKLVMENSPQDFCEKIAGGEKHSKKVRRGFLYCALRLNLVALSYMFFNERYSPTNEHACCYAWLI